MPVRGLTRHLPAARPTPVTLLCMVNDDPAEDDDRDDFTRDQLDHGGYCPFAVLSLTHSGRADP